MKKCGEEKRKNIYYIINVCSVHMHGIIFRLATHSSPSIKADEQEMPKRINGTRSRVFAKVSHIRRET